MATWNGPYSTSTHNTQNKTFIGLGIPIANTCIVIGGTFISSEQDLQDIAEDFIEQFKIQSREDAATF